MATNRDDANKNMLVEAGEVQDKTKEAILRIRKQALETETLAALTLDELRNQGLQMDEINAELDSVAGQLEKTQSLQNQFDRWAGNFFGGKKNAALKEANKEIVANHNKADESASKIREIFELEKYDSMSRIWRAQGVFLCSNPTVAAQNVFNPKAGKDEGANVNWVIDYSHTGIDGEGWTYAYDNATLIKNNGGESSRKWNQYARRRKWCLEEKKDANSAGVNSVRDRHTARIGALANGSGREKEKIGYVPRGMIGLQASGLTSAGMMNGRGKASGPDQTLDQESQMRLAKLKSEDEEMDKGLDDISHTIDNLTNIAGDMNAETRHQNSKISDIDFRMQTVAEKQAIVNARLKSLIKHA